MKKTIIILIIGILLSCQSKKDVTKKVIQISDKEIIGKYEISSFNSGVSLELKSNSEFIYENQLWGCMGGGEVHRIRGEYKVFEDRLILNPKKMIDIHYLGFDTESFEIDSVKYQSSDSTYIKKEFQIFKWDSLRYLLSEEYYSNWGFETDENDYECFANYYNSGYEPDNSDSYFVKRQRGYSPKSKFNNSAIPTKYRDRFLNKPIIAEIIEVIEGEENLKKESQKRRLYILNKGSNDGIMKKMDFYGKDGCCTIRISKVENEVSYGRIYLCLDYQAKCGENDTVTTFLEREKGKFEIAR